MKVVQSVDESSWPAVRRYEPCLITWYITEFRFVRILFSPKRKENTYNPYSQSELSKVS